MESKKYNKSVELQYKRLKKVLDELEALDNEELLTADGEEHQGKLPIAPAKYAVFAAMRALKMAYGLIDSEDGHQEIAILENVCEGTDVTDIELLSEVNYILLPHPFRTNSDSEENVYEIEPSTTLHELLEQVKEVFAREYELGNCEAPFEMHEFFIEHITVHKNKSAHIYIRA